LLTSEACNAGLLCDAILGRPFEAQAKQECLCYLEARSIKSGRHAVVPGFKYPLHLIVCF